MPCMGLGTWQLAQGTAGTVAQALGLGYRLIDTSGDYGTQPGIDDERLTAIADNDDMAAITGLNEEYSSLGTLPDT